MQVKQNEILWSYKLWILDKSYVAILFVGQHFECYGNNDDQNDCCCQLRSSE